MANIVLNDVLNVTYGCSMGPQNGLNRIQYVVGSTVGPVLSDQAWATVLSTTVAAGYKNYLNVNARFLGLRLQKVFPGIAPPGVSATAGTGVGTIAGDPLPTQVAMLFTKRTPVGGKVGRGRVYLPFWSESDNDIAGKPTALALGNGNALANQILNPMTLISGASSVTINPCLAKKSNGWLPLQLDGYVQRQNWATQRRRSQINRGDSVFPPV